VVNDAAAKILVNCFDELGGGSRRNHLGNRDRLGDPHPRVDLGERNRKSRRRQGIQQTARHIVFVVNGGPGQIENCQFQHGSHFGPQTLTFPHQNLLP